MKIPRSPLLIVFLAGLIFAFSTTVSLAFATCSFSIGGLGFGNIEVINNTQFTTSSTLTANCGGGDPFDTLTICVHLDDGTGGSTGSGSLRQLISGPNSLNFNIYKEVANINIWGGDGWFYDPPQWLVALDGSGNANESRTIYAQIPAGQTTAPSGNYSSAFSGGNEAIIRYKTNIHPCTTVSSAPHATTTAAFNVNANVVDSCQISTNDLDFGSMGSISSNVDSSNTLSVICSNGLPYIIGLDGGLSGAVDPSLRQMTLAGDDVTYGLYQDAGRSAVWGDANGVNTVSGTGSGLSQNLTIHGRVPAQASPPAGTYTDTIVTTVTY